MTFDFVSDSSLRSRLRALFNFQFHSSAVWDESTSFLCLRNIDLEELIAADAEVPNTCYDLIANLVHDGDPNEGKGSYRVHILHQVSAQKYTK